MEEKGFSDDAGSLKKSLWGYSATVYQYCNHCNELS